MFDSNSPTSIFRSGFSCCLRSFDFSPRSSCFLRVSSSRALRVLNLMGTIFCHIWERMYCTLYVRVIGCLRMSTQCSGAMARDGWLLYSQSIDQDCIEIRYLLNNPSRLSRSRAGERQTEALCLGWWSRYSTYPHSADAEANVLVQKRRIVYGTGT